MLASQLLAHGESVHAGKHPVEDHEVGTRAIGGRQGVDAVERLVHEVPLFFQVRSNQVGEGDLVFDDENPGH